MQMSSLNSAGYLAINPIFKTLQSDGVYVGPRVSMVTPWSTNAVEITQNMGIEGIVRMSNSPLWHRRNH
ncbi:MAG: hypothetical protein CM15mP59_4340 [Flavobacteriaceae bacterium]|nr:MAG: hypothetical protein CM15mP59_4340 [Flavobacteriaceae bacterium]